MEQELPLTPAMIDYAQSQAFRKGNVISMVIFLLVFCCTAPAFLTFVLLVQHRPLGPGLAVAWVVFGLAGSGMIYLGLRGARVVSRDLAGGVYVRWTGPFTTRVVWVEAYRKRKGLEVEAGGSKLGSVPLELLPIGYNSGTIDYLPASRHMLELRNDQGAVLWTRLVTTDDSLGPPSPPPG
jgi:hypothetical protein